MTLYRHRPECWHSWVKCFPSHKSSSSCSSTATHLFLPLLIFILWEKSSFPPSLLLLSPPLLCPPLLSPFFLLVFLFLFFHQCWGLSLKHGTYLLAILSLRYILLSSLQCVLYLCNLIISKVYTSDGVLIAHFYLSHVSSSGVFSTRLLRILLYHALCEHDFSFWSMC